MAPIKTQAEAKQALPLAQWALHLAQPLLVRRIRRTLYTSWEVTERYQLVAHLQPHLKTQAEVKEKFESRAEVLTAIKTRAEVLTAVKS